MIVHLLSLLLLLTCVATSYGSLLFTPAKNYPNLELMLPLFDHAQAEPLPMPRAQAFLLIGGNGLAWEDRFNPFELWYHTQCCGRWRDATGNQLVIGRATHRLPVFAEEVISRERFLQRLGDADSLLNVRKMNQLDEWVATFADTPVYAPETLKLNSFTLDQIRFYPCEAPDKLVYAFLPRRVGNSQQADWFCVTLYAPGMIDRAALRDLFESTFLVNIQQSSKLARTQGVSATQLSVQRKGERAIDQPNHPVRLTARKSVENYEDWWFAETEGYTILSNADSVSGKSLIRELQETLPVWRQAFARLVPPLTDSHEVALLRLFQRRADYVNYVGPDYAWSGGMWLPSRRELVVHLEVEPKELMTILRHESFHQYLSYAYAMIPAAAWFNEGHACFFESSHQDARGRLIIDEDPSRVNQLLDQMDEVIQRLPSLFQPSYELFYAGTNAERQLKYTMAWGLAYYLQKGAPLERNTPYRTLLADYATALADTHDGDSATTRAFAEIDMPLFLSNFQEFWIKRRNTALQYDPINP